VKPCRRTGRCIGLLAAALVAVQVGRAHAGCTIYVSDTEDAEGPFWSVSGGSDDKMLFREAVEVGYGVARCYTSFEMARIEGGNFVHDPVFCASTDNSRNWRLSFSDPGCGPDEDDTIRFWDAIRGGTQITLSHGYVRLDPRDSIDGGAFAAGARPNIALHGAPTCPVSQSGAIVTGVPISISADYATGTIGNLYLDGFCGFGIWAPRANGLRVRDVVFSSISGNAVGGGTALILGQLEGTPDDNDKCVRGVQIGGTGSGEQNYFFDIEGYAISVWDTCTGDLSDRNNKLFNNYIGQCEALDTGPGLEACADGTPNQGIGGSGIRIVDSNDTLVGGAGAGEANYIARAATGVDIVGNNALGNAVRGNRIGVSRQGDFARGNGTGVRISGGADDNIIGGTGTGEGNTISSNTSRGVTIDGTGTSGNRVSGNVIGLTTARTQLRPNGDGIGITGGADDAQLDHNVIAGNTFWGIYVNGGSAHLIGTNIIGLRGSANDANDNHPAANGNGGVWINDVAGNTVGPGNRIAGNQGPGVLVSGENADGNVIKGNVIGLDNGNTAVANSGAGIDILGGADDTVIGGAALADGNIIGGNGGAGIHVSGDATNATTIRYNFVGTDRSGNVARANGVEGIRLDQGANHADIRQNLVSGNANDGIKLETGASGNLIVLNQIGFSVGGAALPNGASGISLLSAAHDNTIGDATSPALLNYIAGNTGAGVFVADAGTAHNIVGENLIGVSGLPNGTGVIVTAGAVDTQIVGNLIEANTGSGVAIAGSGTIGNPVLDNLIRANGGLGIDLGANGVTANDAGDGDGGPDNQQNFPSLDNVIVGTNSATLTASLSSQPNQTYLLTFYRSDHCDPSGYGEGQVRLGSATLHTAANGGGSVVGLLYSVPNSQTRPSWGTAIATSPGGDTSEFSRCVALSDKIFGDGFEDPATFTTVVTDTQDKATPTDDGPGTESIHADLETHADGSSSVSLRIANTTSALLPAQVIGATLSDPAVVGGLHVNVGRCALEGRIECRLPTLAAGAVAMIEFQLDPMQATPATLSVVSEVHGIAMSRTRFPLPARSSR
jgi:hypothetical protein